METDKNYNALPTTEDLIANYPDAKVSFRDENGKILQELPIGTFVELEGLCPAEEALTDRSKVIGYLLLKIGENVSLRPEHLEILSEYMDRKQRQ